MVKPILWLFVILKLGVPGLAEEFRIGEYRAYPLMGEARLSGGTDYVSFTGDFGFSGWVPPKEKIEQHLAVEAKLLSHFRLSLINLEYMLPGFSGRQLDREIDKAMTDTLSGAGYDVIARANNHAMDHGVEGLRYNATQLKRAGLALIGTQDSPVYELETGGQRLALFALTEYTDHEDPGSDVLRIDEDNLDLIKQRTSQSHFCIVFVHLGSMSSYVSPHEREQVRRLIKVGAGLVVCTGSHFIKGFVLEEGKPVVYGIGNHLFSTAGGDTEPVGMHLVAGFRSGKLVQIFAVPFLNTIREGKTGPLDETGFAWFKKALLERSTSDTEKYYSDPRSLNNLKERLSQVGFPRLKEVRPRHFVYAGRILFHQHPIMTVAVFFLALAVPAVLVGWAVLMPRWRTRCRRQAT
jgi:hypothetical protein